MFAYYFQLGLRSLRRNPALTALIVLAIGFGVAASMTTYAVFRAMSGDPIPWKSSKLFVPQIDPWGPGRGRGRANEPPDLLTYTDAVALMRMRQGALQSAMYPIGPAVYPADGIQKPSSEPGHAVYAAFFSIVEAPFLHGGAWTPADDDRHAQVAVIGRELSQRLFGNADSVGKSIRLARRDYRIVGVLDTWRPQPMFYDLASSDAFGQFDQVFVPFTTAIEQQLDWSGDFSCDSRIPTQGFAGAMASSCVWISYLVELDGAAQVRAYRSHLDAYAQEQRAAGRFRWPPNNRLRDLPAWMTYEQVVPPQVKTMIVLAFCLLLVCMVNAVGLLLSKFLRRSGEIGVRRALGASRFAVAAQFGMESGTLGLAGGALGLLLTWLGVLWVRGALPQRIAVLTRIDPTLLWQALLLAVLATVAAGLYPTWRAAVVRPALQLKTD